jgi:hypothetical protein
MIMNTLAVLGHMTITTRARLSAVTFYQQFGFKTIEDDLTFTREVDNDEWDWLGDSDDGEFDADKTNELEYVNLVRFGVPKENKDKE